MVTLQPFYPLNAFMQRIIFRIFILLGCLLPFNGWAQDQSSKEAKELFTKVYNSVFGEQGSSLTYAVNIIGLYKTNGDIMYKGKKIYYKESRFMSWQDGVTAYMVDQKKKVVNIYRYDDENKDKYLSKFKCDLNNFTYSYKTEGDYYLIQAKLKDASYFGIRWVEAKVYKSNLHPVSITVKLAFMRTTVKISNFKSGNIADSNFVFPKAKFTSYQTIDHRNESKKK